MSVPKQVEEAAELAEEYVKGLNTNEEDPKAGEEVDTDKLEEESDKSADDETNTKEEEQEERNIFEEKYRVLQGKYDKEVPRLHNELKELKEKIFERIGDMSQKKEENEEPVVDKNLEAFKEEYGEDLINYLDSYFESKMKPAIKAHTEESIEPVQQKVTSIEEAQVETAKNEFAAYLDEHVNGSWRDAGEDPKFLEFLEQEDPSGFNTYGELLERFNSNWDEKKMVKVFNTFYGEKTKSKTESSPDKEAIVAPSRKTQAQAPSGDDKIMWTPESIKQFERDDRSGKYSPEESMKLWDDLLHAPSENRIN